MATVRSGLDRGPLLPASLLELRSNLAGYVHLGITSGPAKLEVIFTVELTQKCFSGIHWLGRELFHQSLMDFGDKKKAC